MSLYFNNYFLKEFMFFTMSWAFTLIVYGLSSIPKFDI
jgi:hypothetical protein